MKIIENAYHGKRYYFLCKVGKRELCYNADAFLNRIFQ